MSTRFQLLELVVEDMGKSLGFYRGLGFDIPSEADAEPHVDVDLGGGMRIAWDTVEVIRAMDPSWTPPSGGHRMAIAFQCDSPADVDATFERLTAAGYEGHLEPFDAFWGHRYAVVHDPDGNPVDFFAPLAGE